MDLDILLEQLGEDGVYALSDGLYSQLQDDFSEILSLVQGMPVPDVLTIDTVMENLACLRTMRLQYDELGKALDKYAYPDKKEV